MTAEDRYIIGIDPGSSGGGYAVLSLDGVIIHTGAFKTTSPHDFATMLQDYPIAFAWLEKVHAMPGQGVVSMFSFGENFGIVQGVLSALRIPFELVQPRDWQKMHGIKSKVKANKKKQITGETNTQWKNRLKAAAQRLFPQAKITLAIADALLIAEAARREYIRSLQNVA